MDKKTSKSKWHYVSNSRCSINVNAMVVKIIGIIIKILIYIIAIILGMFIAMQLAINEFGEYSSPTIWDVLSHNFYRPHFKYVYWGFFTSAVFTRCLIEFLRCIFTRKEKELNVDNLSKYNDIVKNSEEKNIN